jgi:hypothetical protein
MNAVGVSEEYLSAYLAIIVSQSDVDGDDAGHDASGGYAFQDLVEHSCFLCRWGNAMGGSFRAPALTKNVPLSSFGNTTPNGAVQSPACQIIARNPTIAPAAASAAHVFSDVICVKSS